MICCLDPSRRNEFTIVHLIQKLVVESWSGEKQAHMAQLLPTLATLTRTCSVNKDPLENKGDSTGFGMHVEIRTNFYCMLIFDLRTC